MREVNYGEWQAERLEEAGVAIVLSDGGRFVLPPFDMWPEVKGMTDAEVMQRLAGDLAEQAVAEGVTPSAVLAILRGDDGTGEKVA